MIHALRSHFGSGAVAPTPWATMVRSWFFETALSHGPTVEMARIWTEVAKEFNGHVMLTKSRATTESFRSRSNRKYPLKTNVHVADLRTTPEIDPNL